MDVIPVIDSPLQKCKQFFNIPKKISPTFFKRGDNKCNVYHKVFKALSVLPFHFQWLFYVERCSVLTTE